jgi:hypothetical protein
MAEASLVALRRVTTKLDKPRSVILLCCGRRQAGQKVRGTMRSTRRVCPAFPKISKLWLTGMQLAAGGRGHSMQEEFLCTYLRRTTEQREVQWSGQKSYSGQVE